METAETITRDDVRRLVEARPFRPFTLALEGGDRLRARHPECVEIGDDGSLSVTDDHNPGAAAGTILRIELDPVAFGPITKRRARRDEVETVIALATLFDGGTPEGLRGIAKATGLSATWAALRLAGVEKLATFEAVERRARELAALRADPGAIDMGWLAVVRVYGACVLATMCGEHLATNSEIAIVAGVVPGGVPAALQRLEGAGLVRRSFELGLVGPRKIGAVDFALG